MYSGNQASYDNLSENMKQKLEGLKTPIVNDLTTGGSDKALSAESGKELKSLVDEKADSEDLKSLQTEVTEHLAEIATTDKLGHIKPDGITIKVDSVSGVAKAVGGNLYQEDNMVDDKSSAIGLKNYVRYTPYASKLTNYNEANKTVRAVTATNLAVGDEVWLRRNDGGLAESKVISITPVGTEFDIKLSDTTVMMPPFFQIAKKVTDTTTMRNQLASGKENLVTGANAQAFGERNIASGGFSIAAGNSSVAEGSSCIALGSSARATGSVSLSLGIATLSTGFASIAMGANSKASGDYSLASGSTSEATATTSIAMGSGAKATGNASVALGNSSVASASYALASGDRASVTHQGGFAHGVMTKSQAIYAVAFGDETISNTYAATAIGVKNKSMSGSQVGFTSVGDAFVIGNGSGSQSNAFRVTFEGKTYGLSAFNSSGADYAEYFEWMDGNPRDQDRVGYVVTLDKGKIRKATAKDSYILGIVSATPSVIGDSCQDDWNNKYVTDEWNRIQFHWIDVEYEEDVEVVNDNGTTGIEKVPKTRKDYVQKLNPNWNPDQEYTPREERAEWDAVGLVGKLLVRDDGTLYPNNFAKVGSLDGELTLSETPTNIRVMERISENIVRVFIK